jgi:hypothetical protein
LRGLAASGGTTINDARAFVVASAKLESAAD